MAPTENPDGPTAVTPNDDEAVLGGRGPAMIRAFLEAKVKKAAARPPAVSREEHEATHAAQRQELMRCLGLDPLPPRTPLNARIAGVTQREGYRIEKIVFESRPRFTVTALLYVPDGAEDERLPVIVNPIGHWPRKKAEPTVQSRLIFEALHGYLALVIDSPGFSFEGDNKVERREAGAHFDLKLVLGSANTTALYVWDIMRAVDYLQTRPEADLSRLGITGASGGGLATLYAFAADTRFTCAVPAVYATSMEVNPYNGCECNHVPGVLQMGDRADILALRAPAPVFLIGATQDREFPPEGTQLSGEKLKRLWGLYGAEADTDWKVFPGPHDYNQAMRETAMGFFDKHLKGIGDGSSVPEPPHQTEPIDLPALFCLDSPLDQPETMRNIAVEMLRKAKSKSWAEVVKLNGGAPTAVPLNYAEAESEGAKRYVTFDSEADLIVPGILWLPAGTPCAGVVFLSERGKAYAESEFPIARLTQEGFACLAIDARGRGELSGLDNKLMTYLGTSIPFAMGWDAHIAANALRRYTKSIAVVGAGPSGAQAALFAGLIDPTIGYVAGLHGLHEYADCFRDDVPVEAIQPRANYGAPLSLLRQLVNQPHHWSFLGEDERDLLTSLNRWVETSAQGPL